MSGIGTAGMVSQGTVVLGMVSQGWERQANRKEIVNVVFQPKRNYEWNPDTGYHPSIDANIVGGVIEQLEEQNGGVTADAFLEASRPENSPTHSVFEWNDGIAAENWRKHQSRTTINALRVVYIDRQGEEQKVSAFIRTSKPATPTVYENIHAALSDENKKEIVLDRLRKELEGFVIRNSHIEELADLLEEASEKARERKGK